MEENLLNDLYHCLEDGKCSECSSRSEMDFSTCETLVLSCQKRLSFYETLYRLPKMPSDDYKKQIHFAARQLIKNPEYLEAVLTQYDGLVKQSSEIYLKGKAGLPYWCYDFWGRKTEEKQEE